MAALLCVAGVAGAEAAETYPSRPVKMIVGFAPGGNSDIYARLLSSRLQKVLGQPVVVENKPGAASILDKTTSDGDRARGDLSPEGFAKFIADETEMMRRVIEPLKIRLD